MKPITAIIIDDEKHARESLFSLLDLYCPEVQVLAFADNIEEGKSLIEKSKPHVVFLDINIGEKTGFDLLSNLDNKNFQLIFITAYSEYAVNAFQANAIDYLLKPIAPSLLKKAVEKAQNSIQKNLNDIELLFQSLQNQKKNRISISTTEGISFIELEQVTQVSGSGNYSTFFLQSGEKILASKGLKHYERILPSNIFFRSHQSHIVNLTFIKSIIYGGSTIKLSSGELVPVSKSRKNQLLKSMV